MKIGKKKKENVFSLNLNNKTKSLIYKQTQCCKNYKTKTQNITPRKGQVYNIFSWTKYSKQILSRKSKINLLKFVKAFV